MGGGGLLKMNTLFLALPTDPRAAPAATHWWLVGDDGVLLHGADEGWLGRTEGARTVGIADPAATRLEPIPADALGNPQLTGKALIERRAAALGEARVVAGDTDFAIVDVAMLADWQDWAARSGSPLDHVVPIAALLPRDETWHRYRLGDWMVLANGHRVLFDEPAIAPLVTVGEPVAEVPGHDWLVVAAGAPLLDLAPRRRQAWTLDPGHWRRLGWLAAALGLILILMPLVETIRWNSAASDLDEESAALASQALGRDVTAEEAEGALRLERVTPQGSAGAMLAALTDAMEAQPDVRAQSIDYANGRLSVALTASDPAGLQAVADILQRAGWRIAVQQTGSPSATTILLDMEAF